MPNSDLQQLSNLFSDYRAEWSSDLFAKLFIAPPYFSKLETGRPCVLIGGRGTGKTTSLRSLRFDASAARLASDNLPPDTLPYYGIYVRINKNRVRAFQGPQFPQTHWDKAFAHYFNLLCSIELCLLVNWLEQHGFIRRPDLSTPANAFGFDSVDDSRELLKRLSTALIQLELHVNNPPQSSPPVFSLSEAPLRYFAEALQAAFKDEHRLLFCCIDEYENLLDSQQAILNTYIKHSTPPLSYKIGVKRGGLRNRATIDASDALSTPDDYLEIDISQESFEVFAGQVVEHRLQRAREDGVNVAESVDEFLPDLPFSIEADLLGASRIAESVMKEIVATADSELVEWAQSTPETLLYFVRYWSEGGHGSAPDLARSWMEDPATWATRIGNYGYASLFWLSKGRKGARIRKYYAGARTFIGLASGNIRYFIQLIDEALSSLIAESGTDWNGFIPAISQTLGARAVGKRRLDQLESMSEHGAEIKRLVLAIGKVFFEFARDPVGRTPERNSFIISGDAAAREKVIALLQEGVSSLAFEVQPKTKATTQLEIRDDEFRLHPIFAPFFEYSHRKKRRSIFPAEVLLDIFTNPAQAMAKLLGHQPTSLEELPRQLAMFSEFYEPSGK
jgi:hypothetical protein